MNQVGIPSATGRSAALIAVVMNLIPLACVFLRSVSSHLPIKEVAQQLGSAILLFTPLHFFAFLAWAYTRAIFGEVLFRFLFNLAIGFYFLAALFWVLMLSTLNHPRVASHATSFAIIFILGAMFSGVQALLFKRLKHDLLRESCFR